MRRMSFQKNTFRFLFLFLVLLSFDSQASITSILAGKPGSFSKIIEKISPAVVNINTTKSMNAHPLTGIDPFFDQYFKNNQQENPNDPKQNYGLGSGFIISEDGKVITNSHVIQGADDIFITLDNGDQVQAKLLGEDTKMDLAVLQILEPGKYDHVEFGNSNDMEIGDWVLAMGNAFGLGKTVTAGIISAKARNIQMSPYDNFIQTDASINPGNSGGPLFNTDGKVIGVNTAIITGAQGIGFAIPSNTVKNIYNELVTLGKVRRGWMGISLVKLSAEEAKKRTGSKKLTTYVVDVVLGGPAAKSGLLPGDILTDVNNEKIEDTDSVPRIIAKNKPGSKIKIGFLRNNQNFETLVELGDHDNPHKSYIFPVNENLKKDIIGIDVRNIEKSDFTTAKTGVLISKIHKDTTAESIGLKPGDVIIELNKKAIKDTQEFGKILQKTPAGATITLKILRQNKEMHFAFQR